MRLRAYSQTYLTMERTKGFKKGYIPWNKGKPRTYYSKGRLGQPHSEETKRKIGEANKISLVGIAIGEKNGYWKGDKVGYSGLHKWIKRRLAKPLGCNKCGKIKQLDLANKSGEYKRNILDWLWLCRKCHRSLDIGRITAKRHFKKNINGHYTERLVF